MTELSRRDFLGHVFSRRNMVGLGKALSQVVPLSGLAAKGSPDEAGRALAARRKRAVIGSHGADPSTQDSQENC